MRQKRRALAVIDAETDPFEHGVVPTPFLWGFFDGVEYKQFDHISKLVAHIYDRELIIYAHNGGKFDYHYGILDYVDYYTDIKIINGRIASFFVGECEFRDSINIIPVPLSQFKKDTIDYNIFKKSERIKPENFKAISDYLESDCRYLFELVDLYRKNYGDVLTQASAALKYWERLYKRKAPRDIGARIFKKFSPFYFGGRCEVFKKGIIETNFKLVDIRSAYPFAMLSKHPIGLNYHELGECELDDIKADLIGPSFFTIKCPSTGCFPLRTKTGLEFPDDNQERIFNVTGWELISALKVNRLNYYKILNAYIFEELTDFKKYIYHFFDKRLEAKKTGDKASDIFCKLFMNSLYGKFASNYDDYNSYLSAELDIFDKNGEVLINDSIYNFAGEFGRGALIKRPLEDDEKKFLNVATSASITGFVRGFLLESLANCEGLIYCDTDSIAAVNVELLHYSDALGGWQLEADFIGGAVAGKKLYAFKKQDGSFKTASKGAKLSADEIYRVALGETVLYKPDIPTYSVSNGIRFVNRSIKRT